MIRLLFFVATVALTVAAVHTHKAGFAVAAIFSAIALLASLLGGRR
jgi:hypothetical protein